MNIAIYGYGNLGKGIELGALQNEDMNLIGVFTRRNPDTVKTITGVHVYPAGDILSYKEKIDVLVMCGGSATDLPVLTPMLAEHFNVIDSFDTHARIPDHYENVNKSAILGNKTALISAGWDPGMFSLARVYAKSILPHGNDYTFWGRGVSQGHSDAIRRIEGVIDARQYTVPKQEALNSVRSGNNPSLTPRDKHLRECYVVAQDGADKALIEKQIKEMPMYFADYDTVVNFISMEEMRQNHKSMPHGGFVITTGSTGIELEHKQSIEYKLTLDSNPEFTALCILAFARAVYKMHSRKIFGCLTPFDVAPADLSPLSPEQLRKEFL